MEIVSTLYDMEGVGGVSNTGTREEIILDNLRSKLRRGQEQYSVIWISMEME